MFTQGFDMEKGKKSIAMAVSWMTFRRTGCGEIPRFSESRTWHWPCMAPYVELEWGKDGYALMQQIKALFDQKNCSTPALLLTTTRIHTSPI
ncbi:hypothetical protein O9993_16320 [Vibrio lentus]|nr:hypothetical protein [Vibrio lentus]